MILSEGFMLRSGAYGSVMKVSPVVEAYPDGTVPISQLAGEQ